VSTTQATLAYNTYLAPFAHATFVCAFLLPAATPLLFGLFELRRYWGGRQGSTAVLEIPDRVAIVQSSLCLRTRIIPSLLYEPIFWSFISIPPTSFRIFVTNCAYNIHIPRYITRSI